MGGNQPASKTVGPSDIHLKLEKFQFSFIINQADKAIGQNMAEDQLI